MTFGEQHYKGDEGVSSSSIPKGGDNEHAFSSPLRSVYKRKRYLALPIYHNPLIPLLIMKVSFASIAISAVFVLVSSVVADTDYFDKPTKNTVYKTGSVATFVVDDMPNDEDTRYNANLYRSDGSYVKTVRSWMGKEIDDDNDDFKFNWKVNGVEAGPYYVQIDEGDDDNDDDDKTRSHLFRVEGVSTRNAEQETNGENSVKEEAQTAVKKAEPMSEKKTMRSKTAEKRRLPVDH